MKRAFVWVLALTLTGWANDRPPVPDVGQALAKQQVLSTCKVPPQVVVLPPQVEPDFIDCANRYYLPTERDALYLLRRLLNQEVEIEKIAIAEGFLRAYEVDIKVAAGGKLVWGSKTQSGSLRLICNDALTHCYERGEGISVKTQKDKK